MRSGRKCPPGFALKPQVSSLKPSTMDKERTIITINVLGHGITHVAELMFPSTALLVLQEFFGAQEKYADLGRANFAAAFLFGFAALPSGWLVDRLGSFRVLLLFLFGVGSSLIACSLMPSFFLFTAALAGLGFFSGLYHPAGTTMISLHVREQGKAMGAHGMGGNFGLAITPFLAAALSQALGSWRVAYALIALLPIALGAYLLLCKDMAILRTPPTKLSGPPEAKHDAGPDYRLVPLLLIFAAAMWNGMAYRGFTTFFPVYFAKSVSLPWLHLSKVTLGGTITTAVLLLGVIGQMTGGTLADRFKKEKIYAVIFALTAPLLLALGFLTNLPLVLVAGAFAFCYFANQPVGNSILPRYTSNRVRGFVFGLFFFTGFGAGSIMSWVAGVIGEKYELNKIFIMLAASLAVSALLAFFLVGKTREIK